MTFWNQVKDADTKGLETILDPSWQVARADGSYMNKSEFLVKVGNGKIELDAFKFGPMETTRHESSLVVRYMATAEYTIKGSRYKGTPAPPDTVQGCPCTVSGDLYPPRGALAHDLAGEFRPPRQVSRGRPKIGSPAAVLHFPCGFRRFGGGYEKTPLVIALPAKRRRARSVRRCLQSSGAAKARSDIKITSSEGGRGASRGK
jgi:hypothetical protein